MLYRQPEEWPSERISKPVPRGWSSHKRSVDVMDDENWSCLAALIGGEQVALAAELRQTLSPYYVSWIRPARVYGELQYVTLSEDGPEIESVPVCSYRLMSRAKLNSNRELDAADWQMLSFWLRALPGMDARTARLIVGDLREILSSVGVGWVRDPSRVSHVRAQVEMTSQMHGGVRHDTLFKWVRLFLA